MIRRVCMQHPRLSLKKIWTQGMSNSQKTSFVQEERQRPVDFLQEISWLDTWNVEWSPIFDESQFHQFEYFSKYVRRPPNTRFNWRHTLPTIHHSPTILVWRCFSGCGCGDLWFLPQNSTMKAVNYLPVLQEFLPPTMLRLGSTHFQQDVAPCHKAWLVTEWLQS
jgi:hypothetical protein